MSRYRHSGNARHRGARSVGNHASDMLLHEVRPGRIVDSFRGENLRGRCATNMPAEQGSCAIDDRDANSVDTASGLKRPAKAGKASESRDNGRYTHVVAFDTHSLGKKSSASSEGKNAVGCGLSMLSSVAAQNTSGVKRKRAPPPSDQLQPELYGKRNRRTSEGEDILAARESSQVVGRNLMSEQQLIVNQDPSVAAGACVMSQQPLLNSAWNPNDTEKGLSMPSRAELKRKPLISARMGEKQRPPNASWRMKTVDEQHIEAAAALTSEMSSRPFRSIRYSTVPRVQNRSEWPQSSQFPSHARAGTVPSIADTQRNSFRIGHVGYPAADNELDLYSDDYVRIGSNQSALANIFKMQSLGRAAAVGARRDEYANFFASPEVLTPRLETRGKLQSGFATSHQDIQQRLHLSQHANEHARTCPRGEIHPQETAGSPTVFSKTAEVRSYVEGDPKPLDVESFKGNQLSNKRSQGNKIFRLLVQRYRLSFSSTTSRKHKTLVCGTIVKHIVRSGGRFIKKESDGSRFFLLTEHEAMKKTSKALNDASKQAIHQQTVEDRQRGNASVSEGGNASSQLARHISCDHQHSAFLAGVLSVGNTQHRHCHFSQQF